MTPEERRAAAKAMREDVAEDRAEARAKQDDTPSTSRSTSEHPVPTQVDIGNSTSTQIDEIYARKGGYLRKK